MRVFGWCPLHQGLVHTGVRQLPGVHALPGKYFGVFHRLEVMGGETCLGRFYVQIV